jgi:hypothetical protein
MLAGRRTAAGLRCVNRNGQVSSQVAQGTAGISPDCPDLLQNLAETTYVAIPQEGSKPQQLSHLASQARQKPQSVRQ